MRAIMDIGSSSVRILLETEEARHYERAVTMLGQGVDASGMLGGEPMRRTLNEMRRMADEARAMGALEIRAFATSAVRDAANRAEFLESVRELGIVPELLSGENEALVAYLGAASGVGAECVIDIGGGSAETVAGIDSNVVFRESRRMGSVRALERSGISAPALEDDIARLDAICRDAFAGLGGAVRECAGQGMKCYAVGSSACSLAAMDLELKAYDPVAVHEHELTLQNAARLRDGLASLAPNERLERFPSLEKGVVYTIIAGASLHMAFMRELGIGSLTASVRGNLEGYSRLLDKRNRGN